MYKLDQSKWARARRKAKGLANVAYLRHGRFFVLLATEGMFSVRHLLRVGIDGAIMFFRLK
jgi:hypothetical protein